MNKYIISSLIAVLALFASCTEEYEAAVLDNVQVTSSYVAIPAEGGADTITINAKERWVLKGIPAWLTVSDTTGEAGSKDVIFKADPVTKSQSCTIKLVCGDKTQLINVIQMTEKMELPITSCAEANKGADGSTYRIKGAVTKIANTTYGNLYINDGTAEAYIYGTLDAAGASKNFSSLGIEEGDIITVEGPKKTYNGTIEFVDVTVIAIEKSLIKVDSVNVATLPKEGGDFIAYLTCKGEGVSVDADQDWFSVKSIKTTGTNAIVTFKVAANEAGAREASIAFVTTQDGKSYTSSTTLAQEGAIEDVTCAEFNAKEDGTAQYKVHGVITSIANTKYGNLYINDGTGEVYVYGITDWNADNFKVGDEVTLQSIKTSYKGTNQMKNAVVVSQTAHDVKTIAEINALDDDPTKSIFYLVTGTVFKMEGDAYKYDLTTYGNFGIKDETGEIYVYGVADGLDGKTKNFAATGVQEGDKITILAYKTSYKGNNQLGGAKFIKKESAE